MPPALPLVPVANGDGLYIFNSFPFEGQRFWCISGVHAERPIAYVLASTDAGVRLAESSSLPSNVALIVHYDLPTRKVIAKAYLDAPGLNLLCRCNWCKLASKEDAIL